MLEALWIVNFVTDQDSGGAGVVVFESDRIFGGDYAFAYTGKYKVKDRIINARVRVQSHSGITDSVFGDRKDFELLFKGEINEQQFDLYGQIAEEPNRQILVRFRRFAELPG